MLVKKERIPVLHILFPGMLPSFLKKWYYKLIGYKIAAGVRLSLGSVIIGKNVSIGYKTQIGFLTIVRGESIEIGRFVKIGSMSVIDTSKIFIDDDARINEQVYIGGMKTPQSEIRLGKRTIVMQMSYINPTLPITVGDDSGIGGHCLLFTHASWNSQLSGFPVKFAPIVIGKRVWLPWRVFIMLGTETGDDVVIAANSLVNGKFPSNCLIAGSPAKIIKENYPTIPAENERDIMVNEILFAFKEYLNYSGLLVSENIIDNGISVTIKGKKNGSYFYLKNEKVNKNGISSEVLLLNSGTIEQLKQALNLGFGMAVSLDPPFRIGSNDTGEELLQFFSRYGVRCDRID